MSFRFLCSCFSFRNDRVPVFRPPAASPYDDLIAGIISRTISAFSFQKYKFHFRLIELIANRRRAMLDATVYSRIPTARIYIYIVGRRVLLDRRMFNRKTRMLRTSGKSKKSPFGLNLNPA